MITHAQLDAFAAAIVKDYDAFSADSPIKRVCTVTFEEGKKYIRVVRSTGEYDRSVQSFIEIETGNIWKAASWKVPAKNKPRGHIDNLTPNVVVWTGAR